MRQSFSAYLLTLLLVAMPAWAQPDVAQVKPSSNLLPKGRQVRQLRQRSFQKTVPPGNYSGITWLGGDRYAVVSDKSETDGFFIFRLDIDSVKGHIRRVENLGFRSSGKPNRDAEGIAWIAGRQTLMMVGEADSRIVEYDLDGRPTGWVVQLPPVGNATTRRAATAQGYESLSYDPNTRRLWTMSEAPSRPAHEGGGGVTAQKPGNPSSSMGGRERAVSLLSISLDDTAHIATPYQYLLDAPRKSPARRRPYVNGVSEVLALGDGSLLVLEREVWMASSGTRATAWCKLYRVFPDGQPADVPLAKQPVASWKTGLPSVPPRIANYEGMTLGPRLADGSQTVILIADSQNRYKGLLRDWFKVILLRP